MKVIRSGASGGALEVLAVVADNCVFGADGEGETGELTTSTLSSEAWSLERRSHLMMATRRQSAVDRC